MDERRTADGQCIGDADAWSREAWRVRLLAAELDIALDDDALMVGDVYDLRALGARLWRLLAAPRRRSLADRALSLSGLGCARRGAWWRG